MIPVVVGGDIGAYALIRAFHENMGVRGVVVSRVKTRPFTHSRIATQVLADVENPDALVAALVSLAESRPGERLVLLSNIDWYVETIVKRRAELEPHFEIPMCSAIAFDR